MHLRFHQMIHVIVPAQLLYCSNMKRVRNVAEVDDLVKIIRGNNVSVDLPRAMGSVEHVAQNYKSFFVDCIQVTPRLSKQQLTQALCSVHPTISKSEVSQFAGSLVLAFSHIRQKTHAISTGARTDPAVVELTTMLQQQRKPTLGGSLMAMAKKNKPHLRECLAPAPVQQHCCLSNK